MDTSETVIRGKLTVTGIVHGAINTCLTLFGSDDFEFKQFVTQEQMDQFAHDNQLQVILPEHQR